MSRAALNTPEKVPVIVVTQLDLIQGISNHWKEDVKDSTLYLHTAQRRDCVPEKES